MSSDPLEDYAQNKDSSILNECENLTISSDDVLTFPIAIVDWCDAVCSGGPGWQTFEEISEAITNGPSLVRTVGMLLKRTDHYIAICDTLQADGDSGGSVHVIPVGMIRSIRVLKCPEN